MSIPRKQIKPRNDVFMVIVYLYKISRLFINKNIVQQTFYI